MAGAVRGMQPIQQEQSKPLPVTMGARPRTVLIVTPSSRLLGARRSLLTLAESLDPKRWRPVVCGQSFGQLGEALARRDIPMEVVKLGWWRKTKYFLWRPFAVARLAAVARKHNIDLIHCNEIYPNPYAVRAARNLCAEGPPREGCSVPVLTHIRLSMKNGMIRKYDLASADGIVVPSVALAHEFDAWEDHDRRVTVIYNGVNLEEFQRTRSVEAARLQIGLPADGILLGAIGQLGPRKGGDIILDAFARLAARRPEARLVFVGDPHRGQEAFGEKLQQAAKHPSLAGRVFFYPFTEQILPFYEALDINLLISRAEGFGRTIIEAAAAGVPSIGARVGGIPEIILDDNTGLLVPPENSAALLTAMDRLVGDVALRRKMADAAFRRAAQVFSNAAHAKQMMDLYDSLVSRKGHENSNDH